MTISCACCILVIFLSYRVYKGTKREYTWILGFNTVIDLGYSIVFGFVTPNSLFTSSYLYISTENPFLQQASPPTIDICIMLVVFFLLYTPAVNAIHFWYRYDIMCNRSIWKRKRYAMTCIGFGIYTGLHCWWFYHCSTRKSSETVMDIITNTRFKSDVQAHIGVDKNQAGYTFSQIHCQVMLFLEYGMICYFGRRIISKMNEISGRTTYHAQRYVVKVMVLQAVYPLLLYFIPLFALMFFIRAGESFDLIGYVCAMSVQLFTLLSALSVLVLIPTYLSSIRLIFKIYCASTAIISLAASILVVFISCVMYKKEKREYTWILGFNTFIDCGMSLSFGVVMPVSKKTVVFEESSQKFVQEDVPTVSLFTDINFYIMSENSFLGDIPIVLFNILVILFIFFLLFVPFINAIHFWYRHDMLCTGNTWNRRRYGLTCLGFAVYTGLHCILFYICGTEETTATVVDIVLNTVVSSDVKRHLVIKKACVHKSCFNFGFPFQDQLLFSITQMHCLFMFSMAYGAMLYFGRRIISKMRENTGITTHAAQKYVVNVMILQWDRKFQID
ncbi:unnamed protein product [Bursaphelenchus xylophilus]|uniref:(pine wood nematode) hypothetical protein n=1 Tax=Bursaphelenchus xylophilus TaxID=6326 RepID=A0A1I7RWC5_BURXY|nr:unnamed protein product [Bursaphelenchus xylophilus]CAG9095458.1 unnamed protein product [Bursaphelenchus xylophilus]